MFQSSGTCPVVSGIWKVICSMGALSLVRSFETIGVFEWGPEALRGFKLSRRFLTPGVEISIWGMEGNELGTLSGMDPGGS